jgi:hypothetical protein
MMIGMGMPMSHNNAERMVLPRWFLAEVMTRLERWFPASA